MVRKSTGKKRIPTVAIIDGQSVHSMEGGEQRGNDGGRKVTGRKRHIAVDSFGISLIAVVHAAGFHDHEGGHFVLNGIKDRSKRLKLVFGDSACDKHVLPGWVEKCCQATFQTAVRTANAKGFVVPSQQQIAQRIFA